MWLATYSCRFSNTGVGMALVRTEAMPEFIKRYPDAEFRIYRPEECSVFTPAVVEACMGSSPSL